MTEKRELALAKAVTFILWLLLFTMLIQDSPASGGALNEPLKVRIMADHFTRYNRKLSLQQATDMAAIVLRAAQDFRVDPFVIAAIIVRESGARPWAVSKGGDYGLMQVRWRAHAQYIRRQYPHIRDAGGLLNPADNIVIGTEIFAACYARRHNLRDALLRYSGGNRKYMEKVLATLKEMKGAYTK